jgi:hypothetical protein
MRRMSRDRPTPLPVQALDHTLGYLAAAAALRGLTVRLTSGRGYRARTSLARVAALLMAHPADLADAKLPPAQADDFADGLEQTSWGPALRLKPPVRIEGAPLVWERPAGKLGAVPARW